jgi:hypothetical protein
MSAILLGGLMTTDNSGLLKELIEQQRAKNYPHLTPDKFFERFSAEQILKSRGYEVTPEQITSGIIGGGGDGGVDSFYLFINRKLDRSDIDLGKLGYHTTEIEVVCIQSKNKNSFEEVVITKFEDFVNKCLRFNSNLTETKSLYSQGILDAVGRFHAIYRAALENGPKLTVAFYYASLGESVDSKVETRLALFKNLLDERFSNSTPKTESWAELFSAKRIFEWSYKQPTIILPLNTVTHMKWTQRGKAYVSISSLNQFFDFITENGNPRENIFESNVRDHERDATVNKGIRRTLLEGDNALEEFWWLNNGITIVASQIILDGDKFVLTDPLIVNGLQTSYEIANHFQQVKLAKDTRTILVRILETSDATAVDDIINATNSQTKIGRNSLHATEKIHRDIEAALAAKTPKLFYERRKNYYRNRKVPIPTIITITEMAQILAAVVLQKPDDSRARPTMVVDRNYAKLFNKDYPYELYWVCGWILKKTEDFLDGLDLENAYKLNIKFYVAMYVTCLVLNSHNPRRSRIASLDM